MRLAPQNPYSSSHTLEQAVGAPDDAAKRFGRSALLDAAATERAGLRVEKNEGVACPPWWLPPFMANDGQAHSGSQVAHVDVDDGKPDRDVKSYQSAEQPTPADCPSHAPPSSESSNSVRPLSSIAKGRDATDWWTSSTLLCAFVFVLSVYAFNGQVPFLLRAASIPVYALLLCTLLPLLPLPPAPCPLLHAAPRAAPAPSPTQEFTTMYRQDGAQTKGAKLLNRTARSPKVHRTCQFMMRQNLS